LETGMPGFAGETVSVIRQDQRDDSGRDEELI
jgi:hypothetical protein